MSQFDTQREPPEGNFLYYLCQFLEHGQRFLVYPGAFIYGPIRHPRTLNAPSISRNDIPRLTPLLRTPDGADLACFLLPQTNTSLVALSEDESLSQDRRVQKQEARKRQKRESVIEYTTDLFSIPASAANARATLLMFLGNGTQNWQELPFASEFWRMGCNVLLVSYRGYAFSTGTPSERGLQIDAQTALDYVLNEPYLARTPIILYGFSLGGAVAVHLASQNPSKITALILSNTFTSLPSLISSPSSLPFLIRLFALLGMCTQKWDSERNMKSVRRETAVFVVSGGRDQLVRPKMAEKLWDIVKGRGKSRVCGKGEGREERKQVEVEVREDEKGKRWWGWWQRWGGQRKVKVKVKDERKECVKGLCARIKKWLRWRGSKTVIDDYHDENVDLKSTKDVFVRIPDGTHQDTQNFPEYWEAVGRFIQDVTAAPSIQDSTSEPLPQLEDLESTSTAPLPMRIRRSWENKEGDLLVHEDDSAEVLTSLP
ncbi:Protein bem46 [Termitomyces sp. T112]|nr:Protein bem46 [Termitomyces sp. T112]